MPRPSGLLTAADDAAFTALATRADRPAVQVVGGDLARTLGADLPTTTTPVDEDATLLALPLDLIDVTTDVGDFVACAHVVARASWRGGGWWSGPITAVMNAEFIGAWDVAPRGHPNDGRVEVLQLDASMSPRQRLAVRRRLPLGTHVPHPSIATRSVREADFEFARPIVVRVDGVAIGTVRSLAVRVRPDAVTAYV